MNPIARMLYATSSAAHSAGKALHRVAERTTGSDPENGVRKAQAMAAEALARTEALEILLEPCPNERCILHRIDIQNGGACGNPECGLAKGGE